MDTQHRIWNYPNMKWSYLSCFQASDQKTFFTTSSLISHQKSYFSHFLASEQKTSSTRSFYFYQGVQNGKSNYPNRKSNHFSHFLASDQKTSSTAYSPYLPRNSILNVKTGKGIIQTGNGIIQTGNGMISPTSRPLIKKPILQNVSHFHQGVHN